MTEQIRKMNCWEFKRCGRELGGDRANALGVCPAAYDIRLDGIHEGVFAGRACWVLQGTVCNDGVQGAFDQKYRNCGQCGFYEYVRDQEGDSLFPTLFLLGKIESDH